MKQTLNKKTEYLCRIDNSLFATVTMNILFLFLSVSAFGILILDMNLANTTSIYAKTSIAILIALSMIYITYTSVYIGRRESFRFLAIVDDTIRIQNKKGDCVLIERKLQDITKIVVVNGIGGAIALVDNTGHFGKGVSFNSGEYIKLEYSKKKLQNIAKFLYNCPIEKRYTHKPDLWNI